MTTGDSLPTDKPEVIYVGSASMRDSVIEYTRANGVMSITGLPAQVKKAVTRGVGLRQGKPRILVNLTASKAEGIDWNPALLKIAAVFTLTLQKPRVLQMQGVKVEAVVVYADPLTTQSRLVGISSAFPKGKQHGCFSGFLDITRSGIPQKYSKRPQRKAIVAFLNILPCCLCNYRVN
ncbi:MAG: YfiR/HmsC family protein [Thermodesulfobacteriota bacterium]|nr:YfiR/HmsC family protein [Thermodesulfobacteriota bacterium]